MFIVVVVVIVVGVHFINQHRDGKIFFDFATTTLFPLTVCIVGKFNYHLYEKIIERLL